MCYGDNQSAWQLLADCLLDLHNTRMSNELPICRCANQPDHQDGNLSEMSLHPLPRYWFAVAQLGQVQRAVSLLRSMIHLGLWACQAWRPLSQDDDWGERWDDTAPIRPSTLDLCALRKDRDCSWWFRRKGKHLDWQLSEDMLSVKWRQR